MQFDNVTIFNFLSMKYGQVDLRDRGLTIIEGQNVGNTAFRSNGAGKSILPDAITFCLYGVTVRDLKNDEVINEDEGKNCGVVMNLTDDDGTEYEIGRYRKHKDFGNNVIIRQNGNDISRSSIADNNRFIEELVGLSHTAFTNSVVFGQGVVKYFASYTDREKKQVLEQLLEVTIYEKALNHIKELKKDLDSQYKEYVIKIQEIDEQIRQETERIKEYEGMQDNFETKRDERLEAIAEKVESKEKHLKKLIRSRKKLKIQLRKLKEQIHSYDKKKHENVMRTSKKLTKELANIRAEINSEERSIRKNNNAMKNTLSDIEGQCPVCLREVDEGDTEHVVAEYKKIIKEHEDNIKELQQKEEEVSAKLEEIEQLEEKLDAEYEQFLKSEEVVDAKKREVRRADRDVQSVEEDIEELAEEFEEIEQEEGYEEVIKKAKGVLTSHKKKRTMLLKDKEEAGETLNYYKFWEVGFGNKGIKALLFDSVIPFLNEAVGKYIDILSDSTIEIKFSSYKQLKTKGKTKEEFDVRITNKKGSKNYKGNSGGERRRVDLAILLAFQKLVASRSHKRVNFVIYDEVFENLDEIGTEKVVQLLKEIYSGDTSCFVITHNSKLKPYFPSTLTVKKNNGVSEYAS